MYNLDKIVEDCMIGEVSSSTSKELVKESLLQFGRECFNAGVKMEQDSLIRNEYSYLRNAESECRYENYDEFINSVDNG